MPAPGLYDIVDAFDERVVGGTAEVIGERGSGDPMRMVIRYELDGEPREVLYDLFLQ